MFLFTHIFIISLAFSQVLLNFLLCSLSLLLVPQVPDGATVALIPRSQNSSGIGVNQVFQTGESKNIIHPNSLELVEHVKAEPKQTAM